MLFVRCAAVIMLSHFATNVAFGQSPPDHATVQTFKAAPSYFIANFAHNKTGKKLVDDEEVIAFVQTQQGRVLFTPSGACIGMAVPADDPGEPFEHRAHKMNPMEHGRDFTRPMKTVVMKVGFDTQRAKKRNIVPRLEDKTDHIVSFFKGKQENWQTGLPTYRKLGYENVWDGIDLEYLAYQDRLEFQLVIEPGSDPSAIVMETGAEQMELSENRGIAAHLETRMLRLGKAIAFQRFGHENKVVSIEYQMTGKGQFGFVLGEYDSSEYLVIDPVLTWNTYIGSSDQDNCWAMAADANDNAYLTGKTRSTDFPTTSDSFDEIYNGIFDVFVTKIDSDGTGLVFSTFLGGSNNEYGRGIALDASGNVYITGDTWSTDFPTTSSSNTSMSHHPGTVLRQNSVPTH